MSLFFSFRIEKQALEEYINDGEINKNYEKDIPFAGSKEEYLPQGHYVTNCRDCNFTCHDDCIYSNDSDKAKCSAMNNGKMDFMSFDILHFLVIYRLFSIDLLSSTFLGQCTVCKKKCHWKRHANMPFKFVVTNETRRETNQDIYNRYKEALKNQGKQEDVIKAAENELSRVSNEFQNIVKNLSECLEELNEIALKTASTNTASYIQQMINNEDMNRQEGFEKRIKELEIEKANAEIIDKIISGQNIDGVQTNGINVGQQSFVAKQAKVSENYDGYDRHTQGV